MREPRGFLADVEFDDLAPVCNRTTLTVETDFQNFYPERIGESWRGKPGTSTRWGWEYRQERLEDDLARKHMLDAWKAATDAAGQDRIDAINQARARARDAWLKRRKPMFAYTGPGGDTAGPPMGLSPVEQGALRDAMNAAGAAAGEAWDRAHPELTLERFEREVWAKQTK